MSAKKSQPKSNHTQLIIILLSYTLLAVLFPLTGVASLQAQSTQPAPPVSARSWPTGAARPGATELPQASQPTPSFWEKYGLTALLLSGLIGGFLTLILQKLLAPSLAEWSYRLAEWRKGDAGRFQEKYILALSKEHQSLQFVGVHSGAGLFPPSLKEIYITSQMDRVAEAQTALPQARTIAQLFAHHSRLVILGEAGVGKSTLLDYLTLVFCGDIPAPHLTHSGSLLPIYLRLRNCTADNRPLTTLMAEPAYLPLNFSPPGNFFQQQLKQGHCLVLLDGLDEVIVKNQPHQVVDKINQLVQTYPHNRYVVTCRTAAWPQDCLGDNFTTLYLRHFSPDDIKQFAAGWYRAVRTQKVRARLDLNSKNQQRALLEAECEAANEAQQLTTALFRQAKLYRLAHNPLTLSLIALLYARRAKLPRNRLKLYQECLEILFADWASRDQEIQRVGPSAQAKEIILGEIAYHFYTARITEAGQAELENIIKPLISQLNCPTGPTETLRQIEEHSGILIKRAIGRYGFVQSTLPAYLTATKLSAAPPELFSSPPNLEAKHRYEDSLSKGKGEASRSEGLGTNKNKLSSDWPSPYTALKFEEDTYEVILLYAGLIDDASELISFILTQAADTDFNLLTLAGQCLVEEVRVAEPVRANVLERLKTAFAQPELAPAPIHFRRVGETLSAIGGADVLAFFADLLATGEPVQRVAAAEALGQSLNPAEAVAQLLPQLTLNSDVVVTQAICLALAKLGLENEAVLTALERVRQEGPEAVRPAALWALLELGQTERFGLVKIPAGEFLMGSNPRQDKLAEDNEQPQHRLHLPDYYIAKTPVTNAQYAAFVQATDHRVPNYWKGKQPARDKKEHPVVDIAWADAIAYCRWLGTALPTEAEWEKAARGDDGRIYPWGNQWAAQRCNTNAAGQKGTTPVGIFPNGASPYGCLDMVGNVWEWCVTEYTDGYKPHPHNSPEDERTEEKLNNTNILRVLRGGSWFVSQNYARCASRHRGNVRNWDTYRGFRVVVSTTSLLNQSP